MVVVVVVGVVVVVVVAVVVPPPDVVELSVVRIGSELGCIVASVLVLIGVVVGSV